MIVATVGQKDVGENKYHEDVAEERILAAMELAGLLQPLDENVAEAMDSLRDHMSPEDVEKKREEIITAIQVGRHDVVSNLDDDMLDLLTRSATGQVTYVSSNKVKH